MTLQEIYTAIARHLLEQNERSEDEEGNCMYRGPSGLKCPVGALIKDEAYDPAVEGSSVEHGPVRAALANSGVPIHYEVICLLSGVQEAHDFSKPEEWPCRLKAVAEKYNLEPVVT